MKDNNLQWLTVESADFDTVYVALSSLDLMFSRGTTMRAVVRCSDVTTRPTCSTG